MLSPQLTREVLERVRPTLILSGDDHDACVYTHAQAPGRPVEYTLPTFSWLQGRCVWGCVCV